MIQLFRVVGIRQLQVRPARTILTTLGVSLGVALFIGIRIINQSTIASFEENVQAVSGKASLTVSAGEAGFSEAKVEEIEKVLGVKAAVPMVESRAYFTSKAGASETLVILGVDLLREQSVRSYQMSASRSEGSSEDSEVDEGGDADLIDDPLVFLNQPDSLIVTRVFARQHGLQIDSAFEMATAQGKKRFTVRGLLTDEGPAKAFGGAMAIMDIDGARLTFGKQNKVDRVDVVVEPGHSPDTVALSIQKKLGSGFIVDCPEVQSVMFAKMVESYQTMMSFFSTLALLVGVFLITNSISISVAERKKEIGTLRALGAPRLSIWALFLTEAWAMGALGAFVGAWMGRVLATFLAPSVTRTMSSQYLTHVNISTLQFGARSVLDAVAIGSVAALLAAFWPAYRATQIDPLEAMKDQEVRIDPAQKGLFKWSPYLGVGLIAFVSIASFTGLPQKLKAFETINQVLSLLGATLLGPRIVVFLVQLFRPFSLSWGGTITRLAQDNLFRNPRRTASNVMSLMVGLVLVILIASVNSSFQGSIQKWFSRVLRADLVVSSSGQIITYQTQPLAEEIGREIEAIPGVEMGERFGAYGIRFIHLFYEGKRIALKAFDAPASKYGYSMIVAKDRSDGEAGEALFHRGGARFSGQSADLAPDPVVLVSENFVLHFGKKTGDFIDLDTPTGKVKFKIGAVMSDFASDTGVLYLDRDVYKRFWQDTLVNAFGVQIAEGYLASEVRSEIDQKLGRLRSIIVTSNLQLRKQMTQIIDQTFADTRAIEVAALLVGLLGLLNTLLISVMERLREIGVLRSLGMTKKQVTSLILQESLFQGGFGAIAAITIGSWLAYLWITMSLSHVLGWIVDFYFPWASIGTTFLIGLLVALVAGFLPARRAANLPITEALEYE